MIRLPSYREIGDAVPPRRRKTRSSRNVELQRVFVVGFPRSGTTLVQSWLMSGGDAVSFSETHFFARWKRSSSRTISSCYRVALWFDFYRWSREEKLELRPRPFVSSRGAVVQFLRCLDARADAAGVSVWIEKTPRHLHSLDRIRRAVPGARFVVVVRSGPAAIDSMLEAEKLWSPESERVSAFESVMARWFNDRALVELAAGADDVLVIHYEDLLRDDKSVGFEVGEFLGIRPDRLKPIDQLSVEAQTITRPFEIWKGNNLNGQAKRRSAEPETVKRFQKVVDALTNTKVDSAARNSSEQS